MEQGERLEPQSLKNLAWNATDKQHEALLKLEYFLMAHHGYLSKISEDLGDLNNEVEGFYFTVLGLLKELKDSSKTIEQGLKA
jgi:hypothetical protein